MTWTLEAFDKSSDEFVGERELPDMDDEQARSILGLNRTTALVGTFLMNTEMLDRLLPHLDPDDEGARTLMSDNDCFLAYLV